MAKSHHSEQSAPLPASPESIAHGHEVSDVSLRAIAIAGGILVGTGVVVQIVCWFFMTGLQAMTPKVAPRSALYDDKTVPSAPLLQGSPNHTAMDRRDMFFLRQQEQARLNSYAWADRTKGIVQIPIERAMQLELANLAGNGDSSQNTSPQNTQPQNTQPRDASAQGDSASVSAKNTNLVSPAPSRPKEQP
jgi:hypothetical protein